MVSLKDIRKSNAQLQFLPPGLVAVFSGATSGIGLGTLTALIKFAKAPKVYIIGRDHEKGAKIIAELEKLNSEASLIFFEAQFSLIRDVDRISREILRIEDHVDILCMSPGNVNLGVRQDTSEGIDTDLALQYYSRMRLLTNLLPLLEKSISPRVISILAPGFEGPLDPTDFDFRSPNRYAFIHATLGAITMTDLIFEELAKLHPAVSFIHSNPGYVGTRILDHTLSNISGLLWYPAQIPRYTFLPIYRALFCITPEESGERHLFLATSGKYPPNQVHEKGKIDGFVDRPFDTPFAKSTASTDGRGNGVYRIKEDGEACKDSAILQRYRAGGLGKKVFEHTNEEWDMALSPHGPNASNAEAEQALLFEEAGEGLDFEIDEEEMEEEIAAC